MSSAESVKPLGSPDGPPGQLQRPPAVTATGSDADSECVLSLSLHIKCQHVKGEIHSGTHEISLHRNVFNHDVPLTDIYFTHD